MGPKSAKSAKYRYFAGILTFSWYIPGKYPGSLPISSILPQILPQTSSQTQGNSRVSRGKLERNRMEHQTPSVFPGNFRKRKVLGTLCFPFCFPENLAEPNPSVSLALGHYVNRKRREGSHVFSILRKPSLLLEKGEKGPRRGFSFHPGTHTHL